MFADWGRRVREARVKAGLTQAQLAGCTHAAPGTIHRIETGALGEPSIQLRMQLAGALGVKVEDLFPFPDPHSVSGRASRCPSPVLDDRGQVAALDGYEPQNR